ncbi:MAG: hypothetical protein IPG00_08510 [Saprospiraceae bacterium]|nr:hypothetical protein [Saprospiraceae bacterium]
MTNHIATCDSYTWPQTGLTYDTSGIFSRRFTNAVGCDSTYTLDLRILPSYKIEDTIAECGAYLWPIDGSSYEHTGRYSKRFITHDGCDSTYTLVLDIRPQHLFVDTVITNQDYFWDVNNTTYTQSGIYTQKFLTLSTATLSTSWICASTSQRTFSFPISSRLMVSMDFYWL